MTRMIHSTQVAELAQIHFAPPIVAGNDRAAASVGIADAQRFGVRARLFLRAHPRLLRVVERLFGFGVENALADTRLEAIRSFALTEALAGRSAPADTLVRRWSRSLA